jgi:hypothetical protein
MVVFIETTINKFSKENTQAFKLNLSLRSPYSLNKAKTQTKQQLHQLSYLLSYLLTLLAWDTLTLKSKKLHPEEAEDVLALL